MKHKRYRKGQAVSDFLIYYKEAYPHVTNSGRLKRRMAFFECALHNERYFLMSVDKAKNNNRYGCVCDAEFNGEAVHKYYSKKDVDEYSFTKKQRWHSKAMELSPPGWFRVTRLGIFLKKNNGTNMLFYKFQRSNRTGADYKTAKKIEDITWNRPKSNKAFYLMRLSYEYDALHSNRLITFNSELWNRGAGLEYFKDFIIKHDIIQL